MEIDRQTLQTNNFFSSELNNTAEIKVEIKQNLLNMVESNNKYMKTFNVKPQLESGTCTIQNSASTTMTAHLKHLEERDCFLKRYERMIMKKKVSKQIM